MLWNYICNCRYLQQESHHTTKILAVWNKPSAWINRGVSSEEGRAQTEVNLLKALERDHSSFQFIWSFLLFRSTLIIAAWYACTLHCYMVQTSGCFCQLTFMESRCSFIVVPSPSYMYKPLFLSSTQHPLRINVAYTSY